MKVLCWAPPHSCQIEWLRGLWANDKHLLYWTGEQLLPGVTLLLMVRKENFLVPYSTHTAWGVTHNKGPGLEREDLCTEVF